MIIYQLWWNERFHRYLPYSGNARQRRVALRRLYRAGYDIIKFNVDTRETTQHRIHPKETV